jgi:NAD(P)H dehydrogenase (quinone)
LRPQEDSLTACRGDKPIDTFTPFTGRENQTRYAVSSDGGHELEILVLFHSRYGTVYTLAKAVAEGVAQIDGVQPRLRHSREIAPMEFVESTPRWKETHDRINAEVPEVTMNDLVETDGLALGSPTRYGNIEPSLGNFLEQCGPLWVSGSLVGKAGGVFCSTGTMHGGNEATLLTMMLPLMHLGYIIVPLGYTDVGVQQTQRGGTPYGPSCVAGGNDDIPPSDLELAMCRTFGKRLADTAKKIKG